MLRCLALAVLGLALTSCANDGPDIGNRVVNDALSGSAPACSVIWVEGKELALDYHGCEENGTLQGSDSLYDCLDGSRIALYGERFYGRLGAKVRTVEGDIAEDPAYAEFFHNCVG